MRKYIGTVAALVLCSLTSFGQEMLVNKEELAKAYERTDADVKSLEAIITAVDGANNVQQLKSALMMWLKSEQAKEKAEKKAGKGKAEKKNGK